MESKPRNGRQDPVAKFCLAMEEFRRTEGGRVKDAKELVGFFFPHTQSEGQDKIFSFVPREVRAPILAGWKIRGPKAALRDDDAKVTRVVVDAFASGDIDDAAFESGIAAQTLIDWVPLRSWWTFWRSGRVTGIPVQKALATARELDLFDDRWFLTNVEGRGGRLKSTDVICDTLTKEQIVAWIRGIHERGDGSPAGLVTSLGWETILAKTSQEALLFAVDALAKKIGLVEGSGEKTASEPPAAASPLMATPVRPSYRFDQEEEKTSEHEIP